MKFAMTFLIAIVLSLDSLPAEAQPYPCTNRAADSTLARSGTTVGVRAAAAGRLLVCFDSANARTTASAAIATRERFIRDSVLAKIIAGQAPAPAPTPIPTPVPTPAPVPTPPPTGGAYPNKPAHLRVIVDESFPWDVMVTTGDNTGKQPAMNMWGVEYSRGRMSVVANQDGPDSPPRALQWRYPAGLVVGEGVGDLYRSLPAATNEIYIAFSLKHSANFQWNGTSNKLLYLQPENLILQSRYNDKYLSVYQGSAPALSNWAGTLVNGRWYRIEYHVNATARTARIFVDGALVNSGTINTSGGWSALNFSSTYGGGGPTPTQDGFRYIDHVVIAVP